uniref:Synaptobrevin, longin-like domain protein n=1 Tax=Tanacetum cinerariifolium TaxID=118510 RepID=A0A6L2LSB2_TANCI|nr:hypothetical protein [Tanacetum cinerariifolium]
MAPLIFADTHNTVAFLSKSDTSAGFDQVVDFLNAHVIQYALMVNPTIYVSCIKQFWATASIKKANNIFAKLARMGYEKPHPKLTFYKAFFSAQWKFLIHTLIHCVSAKRTAWNEFSCSMTSVVIYLATGRKFNFSKYIFDSMVRNADSPSKFLMYPLFLQVIINAQVADLSSHTTRYTSPLLTQKVFANMRRVAKGFSRVETPLFASMLVQPQPQAVEEEDDVEVPTAPTPPSPTTAPLPPPQDPIPTPPQAQPTTPSSPTQEQPTTTSDSNMSLFNTLMETWGKIEAIDVDEDITLVDVETQKETLIKMKAGKAKLLDEQMAKRLHDEEENIDWNAVAEQIQEKHLDNIRKYQSLKRKLVSIAQARKNMIIYLKNMIIYLKNMAGYKMEHFRAKVMQVTLHDMRIVMQVTLHYEFKQKFPREKVVRPIFEREYKKVQTLFKPYKDVEEPQKKRVAEETLLQESFKKLKAVEVSGFESTQDTPTNDPKEMSEEDVQNMLEIVSISIFKVEALQVKYPLIDWEIHSKGLRTYCKIIRVGGIT